MIRIDQRLAYAMATMTEKKQTTDISRRIKLLQAATTQAGKIGRAWIENVDISKQDQKLFVDACESAQKILPKIVLWQKADEPDRTALLLRKHIVGHVMEIVSIVPLLRPASLVWTLFERKRDAAWDKQETRPQIWQNGNEDLLFWSFVTLGTLLHTSEAREIVEASPHFETCCDLMFGLVYSSMLDPEIKKWNKQPQGDGDQLDLVEPRKALLQVMWALSSGRRFYLYPRWKELVHSVLRQCWNELAMYTEIAKSGIDVADPDPDLKAHVEHEATVLSMLDMSIGVACRFLHKVVSHLCQTPSTDKAIDLALLFKLFATITITPLPDELESIGKHSLLPVILLDTSLERVEKGLGSKRFETLVERLGAAVQNDKTTRMEEDQAYAALALMYALNVKCVRTLVRAKAGTPQKGATISHSDSDDKKTPAWKAWMLEDAATPQGRVAVITFCRQLAPQLSKTVVKSARKDAIARCANSECEPTA